MPIDIAPFSLPNCPKGEFWFEEPRDISRVVVFSSKGEVSRSVYYQTANWPDGMWYEDNRDIDDPATFGWVAIDDHFNGEWKKAVVNKGVVGHETQTDDARTGSGSIGESTPIVYEFAPLGSEKWSLSGPHADERQHVTFRRSLGIRIEPWFDGDGAQVFTTSPTAQASLRVEFAWRLCEDQIEELSTRDGAPSRNVIMTPTPETCHGVDITGYNCVIRKLQTINNARTTRNRVCPAPEVHKATETAAVETVTESHAVLRLEIDYLETPHRYAGDEALIACRFRDQTVSIAVEDVLDHGSVWFEPLDLLVSPWRDGDDMENTRRQFVSPSVPPWRRVAGASGSRDADHDSVRGDGPTGIGTTGTGLYPSEQSFEGACGGQPRPHAVHAHVGVKHARQRFLIEPTGDLVLDRRCLWEIEGGLEAEQHFQNASHGRWFFGFESWISRGRYRDGSRAPVFTQEWRNGEIQARQRTLAIPASRSIDEDQLTSDEPIVALVEFRFTNIGTASAPMILRISYSADSARSQNALSFREGQSAGLVPDSGKERLHLSGNCIYGEYEGRSIPRGLFKTETTVSQEGRSIVFSDTLEPRSSCTIVLRIPFLPDQVFGTDDGGNDTLSPCAKRILDLDFDDSLDAVRDNWRKELSRGARISTPIPHLNSLHETHLSHVLISDFPMPARPELINTSVGTSVYGNFANESCMIIQELIQRGLFDDARRRLNTWVGYQGTVPQPGNFIDFRGMYYGAGGFEQGNYNQHHGWVLWCLCEYYFLTDDNTWFANVADSVVSGCDWVFRQRKTTKGILPRSRGWENGFLPAGSLEDVEEFHYWLSTNALTWRGTEHAAKALSAIGHPEASRISEESDAYAKDLRRGFEKARQHSPLVPLEDRRWVPNFPSRLYCRGRDIGWIREVLEGSIYLLLSGLYRPDSPEAEWILEDYQQNRYLRPPYGYQLRDHGRLARHRGGFSIQPTLLAGLIPHLERDEPEVYIWMLFNSIAACYREEIEGFSEHPMPELGFSNDAQFKTSDEANAVMWIRYLYAWWTFDELHIGRAMPRDWLRSDSVSLNGLVTYHGDLDICYQSPSANRIILTLRRSRIRNQPRIRARFRHPTGKSIQSVTVNGIRHSAVDRVTNDVELTGNTEELLEIEARF